MVCAILCVCVYVSVCVCISVCVCEVVCVVWLCMCDTINKEAEQKEDRKKDERKRTQQPHLTATLAVFACDYPHCTFTASIQAGYVNHKCLKHSPQNIGQCKSFHGQGHPNHKRFCAKRH